MTGDGDQPRALALDQRHDGEHFLTAAGVGEGDDGIGGRDHAEVAVRGFGGMHEVGRRAGAGEGGGDLASDVAGLADAGDDDAPGAGEDQFDGAHEAVVQPRAECLDGCGFDAQCLAGDGEDAGGRNGVCGGGCGLRHGQVAAKTKEPAS